MIIKELSRKSPSFRQLLNYINRDRETNEHVILHNFNLPDNARHSQIEARFLENHAYLSKRQNGNSMYHTIVSLKRDPSIDVEVQMQILRELTNRYIDRRAGNMLCYGNAHIEAEQLHYHVIISSNEYRSRRRVRLTKAQFADIQKDIERYAQERYPELELPSRYNRTERTTERSIGEKEYQLSRRTDRKTKKELLREKLQQIFRSVGTYQELEAALQEGNLSLHQRGTNVVITSGQMKVRLSTIGLEEDYRRLHRSFERTYRESVPELNRDHEREHGLSR